MIEAQAKRRLADELDLAQERGEVAKPSDNLRRGPVVRKRDHGKARFRDIKITNQQAHEARKVRDAEAADPGIVRRVLDEKLAVGAIAAHDRDAGAQ